VWCDSGGFVDRVAGVFGVEFVVYVGDSVACAGGGGVMCSLYGSARARDVAREGAHAPRSVGRDALTSVIAGVLFGISLGMKLIGVVLLPIAGVVLWARANSFETAESAKSAENETRRLLRLLFPVEALKWFAVLLAVCGVTFVGLDLAIDGGAFLKHFHQSWMSHFARTVSTEYGSPNDHPFPFALLLKNWDLTIPALVGVVVLVKGALFNRREHKERRENPEAERRINMRGRPGGAVLNPVAFVPVVWLVFALVLFTMHRPWWTYYYVHMAVPMSLCAGVGLVSVFEWVLAGLANTRKLLARTKARWYWAIVGVYLACTVLWIGSRSYLEISGIRKSPQTYYALVFNEIERFKPFTQWLYADNLTYSFYSGIPMPPQLAVVPLKRLWSGEMTNAGIREQMQEFRPGLVALRNDTRETPFQDLLSTEYRLVYQDAENRLYAHKSIANKPDVTRE